MLGNGSVFLLKWYMVNQYDGAAEMWQVWLGMCLSIQLLISYPQLASYLSAHAGTADCISGGAKLPSWENKGNTGRSDSSNQLAERACHTMAYCVRALNYFQLTDIMWRPYQVGVLYQDLLELFET